MPLLRTEPSAPHVSKSMLIKTLRSTCLLSCLKTPFSRGLEIDCETNAWKGGHGSRRLRKGEFRRMESQRATLSLWFRSFELASSLTFKDVGISPFLFGFTLYPPFRETIPASSEKRVSPGRQGEAARVDSLSRALPARLEPRQYGAHGARPHLQRQRQQNRRWISRIDQRRL